jgi:hypothetical protein
LSCARRATLAVLFGVLLVADAAAQSVTARLSRRTMSVGESATFEVVVRGGRVQGEPAFEIPPGLEILGSSRGQNVSWINGRMSAETVFRYEIGPLAAGRYALGPVIVRVGDQSFRSGALSLEVTAADQRIGGETGAGPATLDVDLLPPTPWVGQQSSLRVRLIQRVPFAEDPQYSPPSTTGFWTDRPSPPESYYADEGSMRVLVTETRTRLYPLAAGDAAIGEAAATVALAESGDPRDPLGWLSGRFGRREIQIRSRSFTVRVRPLPAGAPAGFQGAVGHFDVSWSADRTRTARDVPITVRLDVRGRGNLPLIRPPAFDDGDAEVFAHTTHDSLADPSGGIGRKRFEWTVLPRREGDLELSAPAFAWFDPEAGDYRSERPSAVIVRVTPALFAGTTGVHAFPEIFTRHSVDPFARGPEPWGWALAGGSLGAAITLWGMGKRRPELERARAQALEWLRAIGRATGPDFWRAADEATHWLESRGQSVQGFRESIAVARYGGTAAPEEPVRRALVERISRALPSANRGLGWRIAAIGLALAAVAACVILGPRPGDPREARRARAADTVARGGDLERARAAWLDFWRRGARHPGLAARLAWAEVQWGRIGPAALWVMRGQLAGPRDPALAWVAQRVREGGGLIGADSPRWPITRLEWCVAALLLGAAAGALARRPRWAGALAALALAAGTIHPVQGELATRSPRGVVLQAVPLEGGGIELQPGQMVTVTSREGKRLRVSAGRVASGWVPAGVVGLVRS